MSEFVTTRLEIQETALTIAADRRFVAAAVSAVKSARLDVERQIRKDRFFLTTLEPYEAQACTSEITGRMCEAGRLAGVGPMAAVAGAISDAALEAMVAEGCTRAWVDNGGDIALILDSPATVEVFTSPGSAKAFAFDLRRTEGVIGICSSSGKLGHSISLGDSDVALVIADDAVTADAFATALGNRILDKDSLSSCFDALKSVTEVRGALAMIDGAVAVFGEVPELVEVDHNPDRLTLHSAMSSSRFTGSRITREVRA